MNRFEKAIEKVLVTEEEIKTRVKELGKEITEAYQDENLLVIGILRGSVMFMSELVKYIEFPVEIDFMAVSSYGRNSKSSGVVRIIKDLEEDITGRNILIVEDIIDTGLTLTYLMGNLMSRGAKSVKIVTLLDKPDRRTNDIAIDFKGFEIPDEFVIGFGLDYAQQYRNLPYVAVLKREIYE